MLRHFGALITQIDLYHLDNNQFNKEVENAICKHFRTTLTGFNFYFVNSDIMDEFEEPFETYRALILSAVTWEQKLVN